MSIPMETFTELTGLHVFLVLHDGTSHLEHIESVKEDKVLVWPGFGSSYKQADIAEVQDLNRNVIAITRRRE